MDAAAVKDTMKELENAQDADVQLSALTKLDKEFKPTEKLLRDTKVGVAVNKLKHSPDERVSSLVEKMITRWKEQVQAQKAQERANRDKKKQPSKPAPAPSTAPSTSMSPAYKADGPRSAKKDGVSTEIYGDKVRNSCVEVTYNGLCVDSTEQPQTILSAAKKVEAAVFTVEKGTGPAYRTKMRSLYMNLKDPKNPELRQRVVSGDVSADRLRQMSPQEMAPTELRKEMEEIEKQNLFNAQGAKEQRATTDRFTCGKCKHKKVSYYQMQTRSADEPLTTFCTCENCGNRWKFS